MNKYLTVQGELENVQGMTKPENPHKTTIRTLTDSGETPGRMRQLAGERCKGAACSASTSCLSWRLSTKGNITAERAPKPPPDLDHGWHQGRRRVIRHHTSYGCPVPWGEQVSPQGDLPHRSIIPGSSRGNSRQPLTKGRSTNCWP